MLLGGQAFTTRALRLLELRFLVARPHQPGEGGLEGSAVPADPGRRPGVYPASRSAEDGQLSMTEFRRLPLRTGVTLNVALAGRSLESGRHPSARLSGVAPYVASGCAAAGGRVLPRHAGSARLCWVRPAAGRRRLQYRRLDRRHLRARRCAGARKLRLGRPRLGWSDRLGRGASRRSAADPAGDRQCPASGHLPEKPDREPGPARRFAIYHGVPHPRLREDRRDERLSLVLRPNFLQPYRYHRDSGGGEAAIHQPNGRSPAASRRCSIGIAGQK